VQTDIVTLHLECGDVTIHLSFTSIPPSTSLVSENKDHQLVVAHVHRVIGGRDGAMGVVVARGRVVSRADWVDDDATHQHRPSSSGGAGVRGSVSCRRTCARRRPTCRRGRWQRNNASTDGSAPASPPRRKDELHDLP
jgi:hypothetical protein